MNVALAQTSIAVLDIQSSSLKPQLLHHLVDDVRAGIFDATRHKHVEGEPIILLTRENMLSFLDAMGKDPSCIQGSCEVELARNIGANFVVSGQVNQFDGNFVLSLTLHETKKGSIRATGKATSKDAIDLMSQAHRLGSKLIQDGLFFDSARSSHSSLDFQNGSNQMTLKSTPDGATVLLNGALICSQTPCHRTIPNGKHVLTFQKQNFYDAVHSMNVNAADFVHVRLSPRFGWFSAQIVADQGVFLLDGEPLSSPRIHRRAIEPGVHVLGFKSTCHNPLEYAFQVKAGEHFDAIPPLIPSVRTSSITVHAFQDGASVSGMVYVDGKKLGPTGKSLTAPLCARQLMVRTAMGNWYKTLNLVENKPHRITAELLKLEPNQTQYGDNAVLIPLNGTVQADAAGGGQDNDGIQTPYYIMRSEVTQRLYQRVMGANPSHYSQCGEHCPVDSVSWTDAVVFANRLSRLDGLEPCYQINGYKVSWPKGPMCFGWRLPTEKEWVNATASIRSNVTLTHQSLDEYAWNLENSGGKPRPVCLKKSNDHGLCDMFGNAREWVWNAPLNSAENKNGLLNKRWMVCGSSSHDSIDSHPASNRRFVPADSKQKNQGFRLVRRAN